MYWLCVCAVVTAHESKSSASSSSSRPVSRRPAHVNSENTHLQPPVTTATTAAAAAAATTAAAAAAAATAAAAAGVNVERMMHVTFPLSALFDPHVACHVCFTDGKSLVAAVHNCRQDILVVQSKQTQAWFRIRQRINHLDFAGKYHMCNQRPNYAIGKRCPRGDNCTFAHSEVEKALWMAEKLGQFNISEFISQAGSRSEVKARHTVESVMAKHPGQLAFLCQECFLFSRRVSMQSPVNTTLCSVEAHDWSSSAVLAHCSLAAGSITLISDYHTSSSSSSGTDALCLMGAYCQSRWRGDCSHAHSVVERELWYIQRDCALTQLQILQQVTITALKLMHLGINHN